MERAKGVTAPADPTVTCGGEVVKCTQFNFASHGAFQHVFGAATNLPNQPLMHTDRHSCIRAHQHDRLQDRKTIHKTFIKKRTPHLDLPPNIYFEQQKKSPHELLMHTEKCRQTDKQTDIRNRHHGHLCAHIRLFIHHQQTNEQTKLDLHQLQLSLPNRLCSSRPAKRDSVTYGTKMYMGNIKWKSLGVFQKSLHE